MGSTATAPATIGLSAFSTLLPSTHFFQGSKVCAKTLNDKLQVELQLQLQPRSNISSTSTIISLDHRYSLSSTSAAAIPRLPLYLSQTPTASQTGAQAKTLPPTSNTRKTLKRRPTRVLLDPSPALKQTASSILTTFDPHKTSTASSSITKMAQKYDAPPPPAYGSRPDGVATPQQAHVPASQGYYNSSPYQQNANAYPPQQGGYPPQQGGYYQNQGMNPQPQYGYGGGYPNQGYPQGGYPPQQQQQQRGGGGCMEAMIGSLALCCCLEACCLL